MTNDSRPTRPTPAPAALRPALRRAQTALSAGALQEAEALFKEVLEAAENNAAALLGLAVIFHARGDYEQAQASLERVIALDAGNAAAHNNLGIVLQTQGRYRAALECFETAKKLRPDFAEAYCNSGKVWQILGDLERADALFQQTLRLAPGHTGALAALAVQAELQGEYRRGLALIQPLMSAGPVTAELAVTYANLQRRLKNQEAAVSVAEEALRHEKTSAGVMHLHFVLGDLYDDLGDYDRAFSHYADGNRLCPMVFEPSAYRSRIDTLIESFSSEALSVLPGAAPEDPIPVFIVGMPRSGTSLVEHILAGHPQLHAGGELEALGAIAEELPRLTGADAEYPACISALTAQRTGELAAHYRRAVGCPGAGISLFTDKMPANFQHLGLIELLFPNARIVHCVRNPLDTALSCFFQNFSAQGLAFSFELEHIAFYHGQYRRLMAHWRKVLSLPILDLHYEDVVNSPETAIEQLCRHLGIASHPDLLDIANRKRTVPTASHAQIREAVHNRSVGRWRHYAKHLERVKDDLEATDA